MVDINISYDGEPKSETSPSFYQISDRVPEMS